MAASSSVGSTLSIDASTMWTLRQRLGEVAVALVGDDDRGARLGDEEIGPRDADVGLEELLAQHGARLAHELSRLLERAALGQVLVEAAEVGLDLLLREVQDGRDDVARRLVADLRRYSPRSVSTTSRPRLRDGR